MEPEMLGAGNGRQAPITIKVAFLGSMLGPSALFNTGYRHGANGDGKEPRSVPVLRLTFCLAALANLRQSKRGKEDSAVGCHFGRREFRRLRGALREIYVKQTAFPPACRLFATKLQYLYVGYRA
eukprot:scaffold27684_cov62-Attheya_sp.AAC.2